MSEYHKIQSIFKRDMGKSKALIEGEWSLPEFEFLANNEWEFTEKVDGTNVRVIWRDGAVTFGGRTDDAQMPVQLSQRLMEKGRPHVVLPLVGVSHMTPQEEVAENKLLLEVDFLRRSLGV